MFFSKLAAVATLAATAVSAQINTPAALYQCQPIQLSWIPTAGPYYLSVIPGGQPSAAPLEDFGEVQSSPYTWTVNQPSGTSVSFVLVDSSGVPKYSDALTVRDGSDSCLGASAAGAGGAATGSDSSAAEVASATETDAETETATETATRAAGAVASVSSAGSSVTSAAASGASSAAGRVTGSSTAPAAAGTSSAAAENGASKVQSAGFMAAALAVVVAAAI